MTLEQQIVFLEERIRKLEETINKAKLVRATQESVSIIIFSQRTLELNKDLLRNCLRELELRQKK